MRQGEKKQEIIQNRQMANMTRTPGKQVRISCRKRKNPTPSLWKTTAIADSRKRSLVSLEDFAADMRNRSK